MITSGIYEIRNLIDCLKRMREYKKLKAREYRAKKKLEISK